MKNFKKSICCLIAVCFVLSMIFDDSMCLVPVDAAQNNDGLYEIDGLMWGFDKATGTITEVPDEWKGGELPSKIAGKKVTAVGERAARSNINIRTLIIPEGVKSIGESAFYGCHYIEYLKLPASLETIGKRGFQNCDQIEKMEFAGDKSKIKCEDNATRGILCHHPDFSEPYKNSVYYRNLMNVKLTGNFVTDAFLIAESQKGYHEGDSFEELGGMNENGRGDYVEMGYYRDTMEYQYFPDNYESGYWGGWCGMFCEWVYDMAGAPQEVMDVYSYQCQLDCKYETTVYAGGKKEFKHGDVVHFNKGHYMIVDKVKYDRKNDLLTIWSWNGNPDVHYAKYEFRASDGMELEIYNTYTGEHRYLDFFMPVDEEAEELVPSVNITFDPAGGKVDVKSKKVYEEALYGLLPVPEKKGYTFAGWYTGRSGKGHMISAYRTVRIREDRTFYAKWVDKDGNVWQDPKETGKEQLELYPEGTTGYVMRDPLIKQDKTKIKYSYLKKADKTVTISVKGSQGTITAENISFSKLKKYVKLETDGRDVLVTLKKGAKKGKYRIKLTVDGYWPYRWTEKTLTIQVK